MLSASCVGWFTPWLGCSRLSAIEVRTTDEEGSELARQSVESLTLLQHLSSDPAGFLSAVGARHVDVRVARATLHAMRTAARTAISSEQSVRRPSPQLNDQPTAYRVICSVALARLLCCQASAQAGEIERAGLHTTSTAAGRTVGERRVGSSHTSPLTLGGADVECESQTCSSSS